MKKAFKTHSQGMAGVYAVASRLCLLGHTPFFPSVDFGVDIMLDNGLKLQVKCGRLRKHKAYPNGAYSFDVRKAFTIVGHTVIKHQKERTYVGTCDFIVFWGIDEDRFFVIPCASMEGAVWIPPKHSHRGNQRNPTTVGRMLQCEEAWHLLDVNGTIEQQEQVESQDGADVVMCNGALIRLIPELSNG
jgi:hypothetical protein